jgi:ribosome-associated toxin RatA of RatAB toxin-antitoxin module
VISMIDIAIRAPAELVFDLARDVERWPQLLPHYVSVRLDEPQVPETHTVVASFVARRELVPVLGIGFPVAWRARAWSDAKRRQLRFVHLGGATAGMDVRWLIEPEAGGCRVTIVHDHRPRIAAWAVIVDRLVIRPVAGRTLRTFKAIAEAVAR